MIGTAVTISSTYEAMAEEALGFQFNMSGRSISTPSASAPSRSRDRPTSSSRISSSFPADSSRPATCRRSDITKLEHFDQLLGIYKKSGTIHSRRLVRGRHEPVALLLDLGHRRQRLRGEPESSQWMTNRARHLQRRYPRRAAGEDRPSESRPGSEFVNPEFSGTGRRCRTSPASASWISPWRSRPTGRSSTATRGNMTVDEINYTFDRLIQLKKDGHFRAFWSTFNDSGQI